MDETVVSYMFLQVERDPVRWVIECADAGALARQLASSNSPVAVTVVRPLNGTLVLSPRGAGSISIVTPPPAGGWMPSVILLEAPILYVPSATGPTTISPGYVLAPGTSLEALEQQITAAMLDQTRLTVPVSYGGGFGHLVLNGAALPVAVLCPANASPPKPSPASPAG
jgi:hypothetical protein